MTEDKIIQMLKSTDKEMVNLGMLLCLHKGTQWCLDNLPPFGYMGHGAKSEIHAKAIKSKAPEGIMHTNGEIGIVVSGGFLQCRKMTHWKQKSLKNYEIIHVSEHSI